MASVQWFITFGVMFAVFKVLVCHRTLKKELFCKDPDTGKFHDINSTWPSTTFCGNYTCKIRPKNVTITEYIPSLVDKGNKLVGGSKEIQKENSLKKVEVETETKLHKVGSLNKGPEIIHPAAHNKDDFIKNKGFTEKNGVTDNNEVVESKLDSIENIILEGYAKQFKDNLEETKTNSLYKESCNNCGIKKPESMETGDRYLTKDEVNTIAAFLYSVKKSDLDTLVEMYKIANDLYSEMEGSSTEDIPNFEHPKVSKESKDRTEIPQSISTPYYVPGIPNLYFYDSSTFTPNKQGYFTPPYAKSLVGLPYIYPTLTSSNNIYASYSPNDLPVNPVHDNLQQSNLQHIKLPITVNLPQDGPPQKSNRPIIMTTGSILRSKIQPKPMQHRQINEMRESASDAYVYPYAFYHNMPSVLQHSNLKYAESSALGTNSPVIFKQDQGSHEESIFAEYSKNLNPFFEEGINSFVQPQQQVPYLVNSNYPFGNSISMKFPSARAKAVPVHSFTKTTNGGQQRNPETIQTHNINYPHLAHVPISQGSHLQYVGNSYKVMNDYVNTPKSHAVPNAVPKASSLHNYKSVGDMNNINIPKEPEKTWKTAPLSLQTLESVRAHVVHKTPSLLSRGKRLESLSSNLINKMKMEKVGTVLKLDGLIRSRRDTKIDETKKQENEEMETYLDTTGCELDTEPGFFRTGDNSKPFPNCCPQRLKD